MGAVRTENVSGSQALRVSGPGSGATASWGRACAHIWRTRASVQTGQNTLIIERIAQFDSTGRSIPVVW